MTTFEEWRPVVGYEGAYEVSNLGRVRSLPRVVMRGANGPLPVRGRILKQVRSQEVYRQVGIGGRPRRVHHLVAEAFIGPRPPGLEICHNNGDGADNRASNLRYDTKSANELDRVRHGTHHNANKTHCPREHEYTPENTTVYKDRRFCKTCAAEWQRQRRRARAAAR